MKSHIGRGHNAALGGTIVIPLLEMHSNSQNVMNCYTKPAYSMDGSSCLPHPTRISRPPPASSSSSLLLH
eukprot:scaffold1522_cov174-Ochromonas_danica.AAC.17